MLLSRLMHTSDSHRACFTTRARSSQLDVRSAQVVNEFKRKCRKACDDGLSSAEQTSRITVRNGRIVAFLLARMRIRHTRTPRAPTLHYP